MKNYDEYLEDATQLCLKKYGAMTSEFVKANKELIGQGMMMGEGFSELAESQKNIISLLTELISEIKSLKPVEPVKEVQEKTTTTKKK